MQYFVGLIGATLLLLVTTIFGPVEAYAQTKTAFGNQAVIVRLCPESCVAVNGHGFKPGGAITVYETKSGWARVSAYLNRAQLVASFGNSITEKPALWVAESQLAGRSACSQYRSG